MNQFAGGGSPDRSSKFAKASILTALVNLGIMLVLLIGIFLSEGLRGQFYDESWNQIFRRTSDMSSVALFFYALSVGPLGFLTGIILAIIGMFRFGLKKGLGVFGLILNALLFVGMVVVDILIGLAYIGLSSLPH